MRASVLIGVVGVALLLPLSASGQSGDNVLVVINAASPESIQVGEYYARKRAVPLDHVVQIRSTVADTVTRADYERAIESPIGTWLSRYGLQDKVLYLVLTKGVPLRIAGTGGPSGTVAGVDSELTLLYRKLVGGAPQVIGNTPNPYFLGANDVKSARPFTRGQADIYLVTRLDGYTVDDVLQLIDRGVAPSAEGQFVLDQKATIADAGGDRWLAETADRLRIAGLGDRVVLESTRALAATTDPVIGYYSWGSNDPANRLRQFGLKFASGALAGLFVSTDGRTFTEPRAAWQPGGGPASAGHGHQSLMGDLIRDGITGVAGHVAEPFLSATIRPQVLFPAYVAGFNLAESFYLAMPFLSWQTVIVGDPLCTPFPRKALSEEDLSKGVDPKTGLPALFAGRRLAFLSTGGMKREGVELLMMADVALQQGNRAEEEALLIRAADLEPRLPGASLRVALGFEARGDRDKANERYRRMLAQNPRDVVALNNLAYSLAEHQQAPKDALPLAERAVRLSEAPIILDTLGWIHHLLGDDRSAAPLMDRAAAGAPGNVDILVHAAFVRAGLNDLARAAQALDAAEKIDPSLKERADIKALRGRLQPK